MSRETTAGPNEGDDNNALEVNDEGFVDLIKGISTFGRRPIDAIYEVCKAGDHEGGESDEYADRLRDVRRLFGVLGITSGTMRQRFGKLLPNLSRDQHGLLLTPYSD